MEEGRERLSDTKEETKKKIKRKRENEREKTLITIGKRGR